MITSFIFDFDGLLIDTEAGDYQAWLEIYHDYDLDYPLDEWQKLIGKYSPVPEPLERLDRLRGPIDRESVNARRKKRSLELSLQKPLLPGVMEFLQESRDARKQMVIASSSPRSWLDHFLDLHGLASFFQAIITGDTVERVKPSPDLFLRSVKILNASSEQVLVIEDSRNGLLAARSAGLHCVIIPSTLTRGMDFREADLVLDSMSSLTITVLDQHFKALS